MQNKLYGAIVGIVLVILIGTLVYAQKQKDINSYTNNNVPTAETTPTIEQPTTPTPTYSDDDHDDEYEMEDDDDNYGSAIESTTQGNTSTNNTTSAPPTTQSSGISLAEVTTHNSRSSCWSAINGSVYDLTSWIPNHPGGEQTILRICGIDGTNDFSRQHGKSSRIASILAGFKIGVLSQ